MKIFITLFFSVLSLVIGCAMIYIAINQSFEQSQWCGFGGFILVVLPIIRGFTVSDEY